MITNIRVLIIGSLAIITIILVFFYFLTRKSSSKNNSHGNESCKQPPFDEHLAVSIGEELSLSSDEIGVLLKMVDYKTQLINQGPEQNDSKQKQLIEAISVWEKNLFERTCAYSRANRRKGEAAARDDFAAAAQQKEAMSLHRDAAVTQVIGIVILTLIAIPPNSDQPQIKVIRGHVESAKL